MLWFTPQHPWDNLSMSLTALVVLLRFSPHTGGPKLVPVSP